MKDNTINRCTCTTLTTLTKLFSVLLMGLLAFDTTAQTQNPNIRIISPKGNSPARGTITIQGSANPAGFARYELSYGQEPEPATWVTVGAANQPVDNNTLGTWNTRPLPDGGYALRLQVFAADNVLLGESVLRNITLTNQAANIVVTTGTLQSGNAITTSITIPRSGAANAFSISDIPRGFMRGATYTAYGFAALGAYVVLKQLVKFLWKRYGRRTEIRD
jgi:hypothetical protein